jgi:RHS repeat-associated protein
LDQASYKGHFAMASSSQAVLCRYHYDPLDRLAGTTMPGQPGAHCFYQKNRLATEIYGAVQRTIVQHEDLLLAQHQRLDLRIETALLATDQQRSVLHLVDTNDAHSLAYNPYGHHPAQSGLTSLLGFNGEHRDPVTGHYLLGNGYRAFNPVVMRFNSPDSLSPFVEGGINAYAYCAGDPVNLVDPSGHIPHWLFVKRFPRTLSTERRIAPLKRLESLPIPIKKPVTDGASQARDAGRRTQPSTLGVAPLSSSRLVAVPSSRVDSISSQILLPKDRFDTWKRLTTNLGAGLSSSSYTPTMRYKAERKMLSDIVSDSRILKKHYQASLLHTIDLKRYRTHIQKAVQYVRLEKKYAKRLENL